MIDLKKQRMIIETLDKLMPNTMNYLVPRDDFRNMVEALECAKEYMTRSRHTPSCKCDGCYWIKKFILLSADKNESSN